LACSADDLTGRQIASMELAAEMGNPQQLREVLTWLTIPSVTALGCLTAFIYCEQKGVKGSRDFLRKFFPGHTKAFYLRCDFALSVLVGTVIGIILYSPTSAYQALAAGLGWTAAFNIASAERRAQSQEVGGDAPPAAAGGED
jgi:hypothetical protein